MVTWAHKSRPTPNSILIISVILVELIIVTNTDKPNRETMLCQDTHSNSLHIALVPVIRLTRKLCYRKDDHAMCRQK